MTLDNLRGIGRLKEHKASRAEVARLLASAETSLRDAKRTELSNGSRLDLAYKAIMQAALAALYANGFRPSTSEPGHQQTTIQTLPKTIGSAADRMTVLDGFRRARNLADYERGDVEEAKARECAEWAAQLIADVRTWVKKNRPELS
ncbi:MAG: hypothetical protein A3G24_23815 [Betaproteobacteria bacterium RIFCSPLOWO2_12_FULL_62_13]|nr:MAG: hypothetical protein A3G24_23815 [Betaproteobacteria bacterium RIFCSPLOWO2_12_FULL_62_13]